MEHRRRSGSRPAYLAGHPPSLVRCPPSLVSAGPDLVSEEPGLADDRPSLVERGPGLVKDRPDLVDDRPGLAGGGASLVAVRTSLVEHGPGLANDRPDLLDESPGLVGGRSSLVAGRPSLVEHGPGLVDGRPSLLSDGPYPYSREPPRRRIKRYRISDSLHYLLQVELTERDPAGPTAHAETFFGMDLSEGGLAIAEGYAAMDWRRDDPDHMHFDIPAGYYRIHALWIDSSEPRDEMTIRLHVTRESQAMPGDGWPELFLVVR